MNRDVLSPFAGMLFLYPEERHVAFWMRNTRIPLDIAFINTSGVIVTIQQNAIPFDETLIPSVVPVQFVLEVNGGALEALGIMEGSEVRHPSINGESVNWPCE